jgi:hypothetical protein
VASAAAGVLALVLLTQLLAGPSFVSRVTVINPTAYRIDITVSRPGEADVMPLATVERNAAIGVGDVIDQGAEWVFRFSAQGHDGGTLTVSRADLRAQRWRLVISADVGDRLGSAGAVPPAL